MKRSTIYRRAAEVIAEALAVGEFMGCCRAIRTVLVCPRTGVCDCCDDLDEVKTTLGELLGVETPDPNAYWWPVGDTLAVKQEDQDARVIGLLLAAELLEEEGR